jgi:cellulose synthase/poly-beta-1,6-N-acetylglucosamine synthase-like glycosyltransferase
VNPCLHLHIQPKQEPSYTLPLQSERIVIGRSPRYCDVVLEDNRVSRVHVVIERKAGQGWVITDLHSANGTRLNGQTLRPVRPATLDYGSAIQVGSTRIALHAEETHLSSDSVVIDTSDHRHDVFPATIAAAAEQRALQAALDDQPEVGSETLYTLMHESAMVKSFNYCLVVIPTYNEAENINRLIDEILEQGRQFDVLVVDDNSPDGTGDLVAERAEVTERIQLLRRAGKQGIGTAYVAGFEYAIGHGYKYVIQMDADFSHQPHYLPIMLNMSEHLCDVAIGSRKVSGGGTKNWSVLREAVSRGGSLYTQTLLGMPVQDVTSGFKCFRTDVLAAIDLHSIQTNGFGFQVELHYRAYRAGFHLCEYPIVFPDRVAGHSKMSLRIFAEALVRVANMRLLSLMGGYRVVAEEDEADVLPRQPRASHVNVALVASRGKVFPAAEDLVQTHSLAARVMPWLLLLVTLLLVIPWVVGIATGESQFVRQDLLVGVVVAISALLGAQSLFTLMWMLYSWNNPEEAERNRSPRTYETPTYSFTALIPARHEANVIRETILAVDTIDYPAHLKQTLILCRRDDHETIQRVTETLQDIGSANARLLIFGGLPINKPAALNKGLQHASHDVVCIFDAEDEPHPALFNVVNTVMLRDEVDVVQSGVQLMNVRSRWFSALNVLEYFFWFKSGLLFFTRLWQVTPLGGNTVFIKREFLRRIGGWDEHCLTEDADLGIRLTNAGARLRVIYDEEHATREETPESVGSFVKQRTRWNQGFLQILAKGDWRRLPRLRQKLLACYVLLTPVFQSILIVMLPFSIGVALTTKIAVGWAVFTFIPLGLLLMQFFVQVMGLYDFARAYKVRLHFGYPLLLALAYYPYQVLLASAAIRAVFRQVFKRANWEKTRHINAHRRLSVEEAGA